ncbi:hypothetical protein NMG60_11016003 [Bertholletia excelsa]
MSKIRSVRKPPLPTSPMRLRTRRVLPSTTNTVQTPPGSLTKTQLPNRTWEVEEKELRPEYHAISSELRALAKMVQDEFGSSNVRFGGKNLGTNSGPLFERGRFYDEYSARRNERLKRKKGEMEDEKNDYHLGVKVGSVKKRDSKTCGVRKSIVSTPATTNRSEQPRYLLRSMTSSGKENKKPPLPLSYEKIVAGSSRKVVTRRVRKS